MSLEPNDLEYENAVGRIEAHPEYLRPDRPLREVRTDALAYRWVVAYWQLRQRMGHEDAVRHMENSICGASSPPWPLMWPPAPVPVPTVGTLSVRGGRLWDGQQYIGWRGVSEFDAIYAIITGRTADLIRRLDRAAANGCNGIRVLMMARNLFDLSPSMPGYWPAVDAVMTYAGQRGLYVELVLFADAQMVMPSHADRVAFARDFAAWADGRKGLLPQFVNEPMFNGWASATDPALLDIVKKAPLFPPFSIGDPADYVKDTSTGQPLRGDLDTLARHSQILVLHGERKNPDSRFAGWVDHLKGFDEVYDNPLGRYRIHDEPMGAASVSVSGKRDSRPDAHRAAALVCAVMGVGFTFHYLSQQDDATPGLDGQKVAALIPQTPNFHFRNSGTPGACVAAYTGWDKCRTCDDGREAWAVAYGHPWLRRTVTFAAGWNVAETVYETESVALYRAVRA